MGIGLPGAVSGGEVLYTTNIPLERTDLAALFRRRLDLPVLLGNDADCAAGSISRARAGVCGTSWC